MQLNLSNVRRNDRIWSLGYNEAMGGMQPCNPYPEHSAEAKAYEGGWMAGRFARTDVVTNKREHVL